MYPCIYGRGISINNVCRQFLPPVTHAITDRLPSRKERETETVEKYTFGTKSQFAVYSTHVYSFKTENWLNRKNIIRHSSTTSSYILKDTFAYVYIYIYIPVALHSHARLFFPSYSFSLPSPFFPFPNPLPHVCHASSQRIISSRFRGTRRYKIVGTANCPPFKHNVNN